MMKEVYLIPYGGLGNQLFQFACASALSKGGKINILCDWGSARRNPSNQIELRDLDLGPETVFIEKSIDNISRRLLNLFLRLSAKGRTSSTLYRSGVFLLSIAISLRLGKTLKLEIGSGLGYSVIQRRRNLLLVGYFQTYKWAAEIIDEIQKVSTKSLSSKALNLSNQLKSKEVLIIHVRRGDYMNENFGVLGDDYYTKALDAHKGKRFDEIWVFSDERELAGKISALNRVPNVIFVDDSDLSSSEILEIMRGGSGYIIANSSFSWWAATLRAKRDALVVSPNPWFKTKDTPTEIVDPSWISIAW